MRLTALQLINFRGFDHAAFDFHPQFNVFIGQNGAGKTALMEALAIAAGTWLKGIAGQRAPTIQRSDARQRGFRENGRDRYEDQYPISITAAGRIHEEDLVWTRRLGSATGKTTKKEAESLIHKAQEADRDIQDNSPDLVLPLVAYYGAGRLWESMRVTERRRSKGRDAKRETSRRSGYNDSMDRRINGQSFATWMEHEDRIGYEQGAPTVYYETVCQAAAAMLQDVRSVRYSPSAVSVVAEFEDGRILPFDLLSDGQRSMLALAGDLAMRMTRLNPSLREDSVQQTPGVVLIDELDLHLHPLWQRQIVGDLRRTFPAVQFIATTHSPFIIQSLQPGELYDLATGERPAAEEYVDQSIEDIAEDVMHTPLPQKSRRYLEMMEAAEDYYHQLETGAPREAVSAAKIRLDEKTMPFSDDPAFQALLALERKRSQGN